MIDLSLPEKARPGLTWRRLWNALRAPREIVKNIRFWWNDEVSNCQHIFVMGPPRSGTTLVKNVLQSHTEICGVDGETWFFLRKNVAGFRHSSVPDEQMKKLVQASRSITEVFDRFAERIREEKEGSRFLEKTPEHALQLGYLIDHFPAADIVFVVRDPRDGLRSAKNFPGYWATLPDKDRTGGYIATWKECVESYRHYSEHDAVELVRYEDFCRRPDETLSEVADAIGLTVQEHQLDPACYGATSETKVDGHARLQKPITPNSVGKWQDELSEETIARVENAVGDEMNAFGYSSSTIKN